MSWREHAYALITALHRNPTEHALIEMTGLGGRCPIKRYFTDANLAVNWALDTNASGQSVFVGVNPRNAMSGLERHVDTSVALALDLQPERTNIAGVSAMLEARGIGPSITAVSGHGAHMYLLLEPSVPTAAKLAAERLVKATGSDAIFNTNRIMRLPGSVNWKKPPRWCYLTELRLERRYTLDQVNAALDALGAPAARTKKGIPRPPTDPPADWDELQKRLTTHAYQIIVDGHMNAWSDGQVSRSETDWFVVCSLVRAGATDEQIKAIYDALPIGQLKYAEAGLRYLNQTIEAARRTEAKAEQQSSGGVHTHSRATVPWRGSSIEMHMQWRPRRITA